MSGILETYNHIFYELADKRTSTWWTLGGPWSAAATVILYLYIIRSWLPKFMENRKPYKLKTVLQIYNILQILFCFALIYGTLTSGWTTYYSWGCQPIDYSDDPLALKALSMCWWMHILKIIELIETVFFVLRKKYTQVTILHLFHHACTYLFSWVAVTYIGGGMATFPIIINSCVHVIMYIYYFLSAMGPEMQRKLAPMKSKITLIQIVQFWVIMAHSTIALRSDCNVPKIYVWMFIPYVLAIFGLFSNFYVKSYISKSSKQK